MKLNELPIAIRCETRIDSDRELVSVVEDSRRVVPGAVFVALRGEHGDGHDYVEQAVQKGAVAVIGDRPGLDQLHGVPYLYVDKPRRALGVIAHSLAGDPSRAMTVVGITGTNGKSSSVVLTSHVLRSCGYHPACFGTLGYEIAGVTFAAQHTTPFGEELVEMFSRARDAGQTHVVMEASSHSLEQERVAGIDFDVAAFTNLTQDHLDYHKDMDSYRQAKLRLFQRVEGQGRFTVVNVDDPSGAAFINASRVRCHTYGSGGECRARDIRIGADKMRFAVDTPWGGAEIELGLLGRHNVSNALCVIAICGGLGLPIDATARALGTAPSVPGRFEHVYAGQDFQVIVDYAHTDDGLRNVLQAAREICQGRVLAVFGCGGDRDKGKRPKMAAVAAELADFTIITSDNPRTEDPEQIILDVEVGMTQAGKRKPDDYVLMADRAEAIRTAIEMARPGDLVMLAGKGHEDYQIIGTRRIHFDDREVARAILEGK